MPSVSRRNVRALGIEKRADNLLKVVDIPGERVRNSWNGKKRERAIGATQEAADYASVRRGSNHFASIVNPGRSSVVISGDVED